MRHVLAVMLSVAVVSVAPSCSSNRAGTAGSANCGEWPEGAYTCSDSYSIASCTNGEIVSVLDCSTYSWTDGTSGLAYPCHCSGGVAGVSTTTCEYAFGTCGAPNYATCPPQVTFGYCNDSCTPNEDVCEAATDCCSGVCDAKSNTCVRNCASPGGACSAASDCCAGAARTARAAPRPPIPARRRASAALAPA